jgi:hypothetical protein
MINIKCKFEKNLNVKRIAKIDFEIKRDEYKLWVFENSMLRRIFVTKEKKITGERRKLLNEVLHNP